MPVHIRPFLTLPLAFWLLITLLVLSRGPAHADWVVLGDNKAGMTGYVNPDTIRRKGNLVKMWYLTNYSTTRGSGGNSYLSNKVQAEYDCTEERFRILAATQFSGNMGSGESVNPESDEGKWIPVAPESFAESLWKYACGKE